MTTRPHTHRPPIDTLKSMYSIVQSEPAQPVAALPKSPHLPPISNLHALTILSPSSPLSQVTHSVWPPEFSPPVREVALELALIQAAIRHLLSAYYFFASSEDACECLTRLVLDDSFSVEQSLVETTSVRVLIFLKHTLPLVFVVYKLSFIPIAFSLVDFLPVSMSLVVFPLS